MIINFFHILHTHTGVFKTYEFIYILIINLQVLDILQIFLYITYLFISVLLVPGELLAERHLSLKKMNTKKCLFKTIYAFCGIKLLFK